MKKAHRGAKSNKMAYANKRQERYVKTKKGKEAINRSRKKEQKKLRSVPEGRVTLRYRRIKSVWGESVANWWLGKEPICEICGTIFQEKAPKRKNKNQPNFNKESVIDHDHQYKKKDFKENPSLLPRGLLCNSCNLLLGHAKDNVQILKSAIRYLDD